jgi:hypothetical protein
MYNISWHTLGLSASNFRNASEFERNAKSYGYTFTTRTTWKNELWTTDTATQFIDSKVAPLNGPFNARHGSWKIMQLRQMGYTQKDFLKENNKLWNLNDQFIRGQEFIDQYVNKLLSL